MDNHDDIELYELTTIECNLSEEQPAERDATDSLATSSAGSVMNWSASGFMMV